MTTTVLTLIALVACILCAWRIADLHEQNQLLRRRIDAYEEALRLALQRQNLLTERNARQARMLSAYQDRSLVRPGFILDQPEHRTCVTQLFHAN